MAQKTLADRVRALEVKVGDKPLTEQFRDQAELIDRRFDQSFRDQAELIDRLFADRFAELDVKLDKKLNEKLTPINRDLAILREGMKILLTKLA